MKKITINFTQSDIEEMQALVSDGAEVFVWVFDDEDGNPIETTITVGDDI